MRRPVGIKTLFVGLTFCGAAVLGTVSPQEVSGGENASTGVEIDSKRPTSSELSRDPYMLKSRFSVQTGSHGSASLYPSTPTEVYSRNIEAANKGSNPDAPYWVARSLELCVRVGDEEEIERIKSSNRYDEEFIKRIEIDLESCKGILAALGSDRVDDRQAITEWYLKAFESGSKLAKAWHVSFAPSEYTTDEAISAVLAAYKEDKSALMYLQSFFAYQGDELSAWSWALTECEIDSRCEGEILDAQLESEFFQYQYETIKDRAAENRYSVIARPEVSQ